MARGQGRPAGQRRLVIEARYRVLAEAIPMTDWMPCGALLLEPMKPWMVVTPDDDEYATDDVGGWNRPPVPAVV